MLTPQQLDEFQRAGIVRVPGAISQRGAAAMCDAVWDMMARNYKIRRDNPRTWKAQRVVGTRERPKAITVAQVVNPLRPILDRILASADWECDQHWGSLLVSFPGSWHEPVPNGWYLPHQGWHLDAPVVRALPDLYGVRVFACLAKLEPKGGATLAVAGSPRLAVALANARGAAKMRSRDVRKGLAERYEWMQELCSETDDRIARFMNTTTTVEGVDLRVVEMTGDPGDVYLVHPLMVHAGSPNCLDTPRIVLSSTVYRRGVDWSVLYGSEAEAAA
jgi:hypothetical protein